MQTKEQQKWASQILSIFEKNYDGALEINLNLLRKNVLEAYSEKWMKNAMKKSLCSNPNIFARGAFESEKKLKNYIVQILEQHKIPATDYTIEIDYLWFYYDTVKLTYKNHKVMIVFCNYKSTKIYVRFPDLNPDILIGNVHYENFLTFKELNLIGLLDFMTNDLDNLIEEIRYKRELACHLWSRYIEVDPQIRMKSFSSCNLSFRKLIKQFLNEIEKDRARLFRSDETKRLPLPLLKSVERDPEGEFIQPFIHYYREYVNKDDQLEITKDMGCQGGFVIKVNDKTAYIKIRDLKQDKYDYIYFQPDKIHLFQTINNDMGKWVNLVLYVKLGLEKIDPMIALYKELFSMYNQLAPAQLITSLRPSKCLGLTECFDAVPSITYGPMCQEDFHMTWLDDYESGVQFYQKVSEALTKRGHQMSFEELQQPDTTINKMRLTMDGAEIEIITGRITYIEYSGAIFIKEFLFPIADVKWMTDFIEGMPAFYQKVFG